MIQCMHNNKDFDVGWVVGLIESRGSFTVNTIRHRRETRSGVRCYQYQNPVFFLVDKDRTALEKIRELLGMGRINRHGDYFHLDIRRKSEVIRLANLLDGRIKSRLRAKQFGRWKEKVLEWKARAWGEGVIGPRSDCIGSPHRGGVAPARNR